MTAFKLEIHNKNGLFSRLVIEPEGNEVDLRADDLVSLSGDGSPVSVICDVLSTGVGNFLAIYPEQIEHFTIEINGRNIYEMLA